jgi:hypothetical protein
MSSEALQPSASQELVADFEPPWRAFPGVPPFGPAWSREPQASGRADWRRRFDELSPAGRAAYVRKHPPPPWWYWFYWDSAVATAFAVVGTFPVWFLAWSVARWIRGLAKGK